VIHESGNETEVEDQMLNQQLAAPITKISLAPDGRFLACYKKDGVLTVMASTYTTRVSLIVFFINFRLFNLSIGFR
jgi:hypothetical protein